MDHVCLNHIWELHGGVVTTVKGGLILGRSVYLVIRVVCYKHTVECAGMIGLVG